MRSPLLSACLCALGAPSASMLDSPHVARARAGDAPVSITREVAVMGTLLTARVEAGSRDEALEASEAAVRALEVVEERLSTWRESSELTRLNRTPVGEACAITPELLGDLTRVGHWWRATDGAFDPSIGALARAFGLRVGGRNPSRDEIAAARVPGGFAALELGENTATRRHDSLCIDEGGFGKGVGLDAALKALSHSRATASELDLGGQIALYGVRPRTFTLADPHDREQAVIEFEVDRGSVATSGNSEHGITIDGQRAGHILDPRTGAPTADFGSMTVWAPDATAADCLSTAMFVLGPERALEWVAQHPGIELLVVEFCGDRLRVRVSRGWRGRVRAIDTRVTFEAHDTTGVPTDSESR